MFRLGGANQLIIENVRELDVCSSVGSIASVSVRTESSVLSVISMCICVCSQFVVIVSFAIFSCKLAG